MSTTPKGYLKTLSIIHYAMMVGPILTGTIFYLNTELITNGTHNDVFVYIFPMFALAGIFGSKVLYRFFINNLKDKETLKEKLFGFQTASLMQYAIIEGPAFLNIIWFSQTGNLLYLTIGGVLVIYLYTLRPTKQRIVNDLHLSGEQKRQFDNMDTPLN